MNALKMAGIALIAAGILGLAYGSFSYTKETHEAKIAYAVAKERCDDKSGNAKDVCVKEAKAVEIKALADAKMGKEIGEAKKDAAADKLDADYNVAIEKCDALAGEAKDSCIAAAKTKSGKNG